MRCTSSGAAALLPSKDPRQGLPAVHAPLLSPPVTLLPAGFLPAFSSQLRVKLIGPEFLAMLTAADVQVPFGVPAPFGQVTATALPATASLRDAVSQLSAVPPELVKTRLALSV